MKYYNVLLTEDQLRFFSRHTPSNLEDYQYEKLSDKEIKKLSDGEIDDLIDTDAETADRNTDRYINKKLPKYLLTGAGVGAAAGSLLSGKNNRVSGAVLGGLLGAGAGAAGATMRGISKAGEEGHSRDIVPRKAARRIDRIRKKGNAYQRMKEREDRAIQKELMREKLIADYDRNAALWANALK